MCVNLKGRKLVAIKLTPEQRFMMNARAAKGLTHILLAQIIVLIMVAVLAGLIGGTPSMWSALAGGGAYLIPSAIVVFKMLMRLYSGANALVGTIFIGEAVKIGGTIALLALLVKFAGSAIVWPALMVGLIATLKAYVLLIIFKKI